MSSTTLPPIRMTREQLIEALEGRRAFLKAFDAETLRKHKADEAAWLKSYRARLREMLKLEYDRAKYAREVRWTDRDRFSSPPECPTPMEVGLDRMLRHLGSIRQDRIVLTQSGAWHSAFHLLTFDPTPVAEVC